MSDAITIRPGVHEIVHKLDELDRELLEPLWLWELLVPVMVGIEAEQFATEGYGSWEPLAESTLRQKARHGYPPNILIRTGALAASLANPGAARIEGDRMEWGTDIDYAHFHQDGGYKPGRPPQRKVIDIDGVALAQVHEAHLDGTRALLERVGL